MTERELVAVGNARTSWPKRYKRMNAQTKERNGEAMMKELDNCYDVINGHLTALRIQSFQNKKALSIKSGNAPKGYNIKKYIIPQTK